MKLVAIVLAGGASSRFGSNKLAAELDGRTLLHHPLVAVAQVTDVIVVVIGPAAPEPAIPPTLAARIVITRDAVAHRGPLAGLAAGLATPEAADADIALLVGGDMPWLDPAVLRLLAEALATDPSAAIATLEADPRPLLPMTLRASAGRSASQALLARDRRALRGLFDLLPAVVVPASAWRLLDPAGATLRDVDQPSDLP